MGDLFKQPYAAFGRRLKALRERAKESLDEVSGAVEIDKDHLARLENGEIRPSEDVLMLLLSHFDTAESEAVKLWEQAGYNKNDSETEPTEQQQTVLVMPMDARIVYTDIVHVAANDYGVVMNFMQHAGPNNQPLAIARIGMSKEHATRVLEVLQKTLTDNNPSAPKQLSSGDDASTRNKKRT